MLLVAAGVTVIVGATRSSLLVARVGLNSTGELRVRVKTGDDSEREVVGTLAGETLNK